MIKIGKEIYTLRGFTDTLKILDNSAMELKEFYRILNSEISYYNSFFRVKKELLKQNIILFFRNDEKKKFITLTTKGKKIKRFFEENFEKNEQK